MAEYTINLEYCRASSGKRLANYFIDLIAFYVMIVFVSILIEIASPGSISEMDINPVLDRVISIFLYGLVMFVIEMVFNGRSLGKLITGTKAVTRDGESLTLRHFLIRNFVRAVPFNALSGFGTPCAPWHDAWSETIVVDEKKLKLAQQEEDFYTDLRNQAASSASKEEEVVDPIA